MSSCWAGLLCQCDLYFVGVACSPSQQEVEAMVDHVDCSRETEAPLQRWHNAYFSRILFQFVWFLLQPLQKTTSLCNFATPIE